MRRPVDLILLCVFFLFGSLMAFISFLGLLLPGGFLEPIWQLNPQAHVALTGLSSWGVVLMLAVAIACALAAVGLWSRSHCGLRLAVCILVVNLLGDLLNAVLRGDLRTLIGIPIGAALLLYLLSSRTRARFGVRSAAV